ncbi:MAG: J domain-containing protein [Acetomicrobium sp.]
MKSLEMSYKLLDLQPGVCFADVKKAFRKKALLCHPDIAGEEYSFQFQQINEAYLALKNALLNKSAVKSPAKSHTKTSGDTKDLLIKKEIENILKEAQEYLSELVKTVGDDCKIKLSDILLRLQSRHPEVRFIAADHLRRLEWEESYMDELMKTIPKILFDDAMLDVMLDFLSKAPRHCQKKIIPLVSTSVKNLGERACIKLLYWGKQAGWSVKALMPLLSHPSSRVVSLALSMLPSIDEVPLTVVLSLIKVKDEEVLIPLLKKLKGNRYLCCLQGKVRELAADHPSLNVRAWASWLVRDMNVG